MLRSVRDILSSPQVDLEDVENWRDRVLSTILSVAMVLGSVAAVPSILISVSDGLWSIAVVDCVALLWLAFIRRRRESPFRWRARNFICLLYLLGLALLLKVGPAAQIYLMAGPVMTALLLGLRSALFALALNAATLLGVGYYANADIHLPGFAGAPLLEWIVITINFAFVNALMTVSSAVLLHKLEISLQKQSAITVSLAEGHERLRESEALYRATFENAPVGVSHLDLDGRWLAVNDELCEITGYSRDEMLSLRYGISPSRRMSKRMRRPWRRCCAATSPASTASSVISGRTRAGLGASADVAGAKRRRRSQAFGGGGHRYYRARAVRGRAGISGDP